MRRLWRLLLLAGVVGLGLVVLERLTLYPFDPRQSAAPTGLEERLIESADGKTLVAWIAPPAPGRPVVLYFHGNAGNLESRTARFNAFIQRGFGVVAAGYRGSSGSRGWPGETALISDALHLRDVLPVLVGPGSVACYGESLGSAVATALAAEGGCDALVLEAPFASLPDMAEALYGVRGLAWLLRSRWPTQDRIAAVDVPLLVLHGTNDDLIPIEQGRAVFEAAASSDKQFVAVDGAGHTNVWQPDAQRRLYAFLSGQG